MKRIAPLALATLFTATSALAYGSSTATNTSGFYQQAVGKIGAQDFTAALVLLTKADAAKPNDPDTLNLLAYSNRKLGYLDAAADFYGRALAIDPNHLGALEYQGELFLQQGNTNAAKANLTRLETLCPSGCEERTALEQALAGS